MHRAIVPCRRVGVACAVAGFALSLQACSIPTRLDPPPAEATTHAVILNAPNIRFFPGEQAQQIFEEGMRAREREMAALNLTDPARLPPAYFLAISGGGDDGAFGAGLLTGWTETGRRPQFNLVTGVSTGALSAPFAFLGPKYDDKLREVYTKVSKKDIFFERGFTAAIWDDALGDTSPLFATISRLMNDAMMQDIANEYRKGRLLLIGTTYLDARKPVIWNIGAIAASGDPKAAELIRKILLASAAVPAAFPPVMIDAEYNGKKYQEMHVDGGAVAQLFLYPPQVGLLARDARTASGQPIQRERHAYIIRNANLFPAWANVERTTFNIAGKAISTMIDISGLNDLFRVYSTTQRDGVDFNLAYIDRDFTPPKKSEDFDPVYMTALFNYGQEQARRGYAWKKTPPYMEAPATAQR
jgi:hypothetical protein